MLPCFPKTKTKQNNTKYHTNVDDNISSEIEGKRKPIVNRDNIALLIQEKLHHLQRDPSHNVGHELGDIIHEIFEKEQNIVYSKPAGDPDKDEGEGWSERYGEAIKTIF